MRLHVRRVVAVIVIVALGLVIFYLVMRGGGV